MKNKARATILLSIVAVIGGIVLNFPEFLMGNPANARNLIVTFSYITIWILVIAIGAKIKNRGVLKYCSVFWLITFFFAVVTAYVNATKASGSWAMLYVLIFICPWYGVDYFVPSFFTSSIITAVISLVISTIAVIALKDTK